MLTLLRCWRFKSWKLPAFRSPWTALRLRPQTTVTMPGYACCLTQLFNTFRGLLSQSSWLMTL